MNLDANVQKILFALLRKWKLLVLFALIGATIGYFYTANFTTLTYTSTVEFLATAVDTTDDVSSSATASTETVRTSNTSKMNYAMRMLPTYIEVMNTNTFCEQLVIDLNDTYNANHKVSSVIGTYAITQVEETAMFKVSVTTTDAEFSYKIAKQLEKTIPRVFKRTNSGLVEATVQDTAVRATSAGSLGYFKKCSIAAAIGLVLAAIYVILRTLLDVRVRSTEELTEKYNIPVLGAIPDFESRGFQSSAKGVEAYVSKEK